MCTYNITTAHLSLLKYLIFIYTRWYCHFDDDVYLNVKSLRKLLESLDPQGKHYLGKLSTKEIFIVNKFDLPFMVVIF
jgi:hypothetical protein